jgi:hypothetical protein
MGKIPSDNDNRWCIADRVMGYNTLDQFICSLERIGRQIKPDAGHINGGPVAEKLGQPTVL